MCCKNLKNKDIDLLKDQEKEKESIYVESMRRDRYYSAMVKDIVKNNRTSQVLKIIFFVIVCFVFLGTCAVGAIVIIITANKNEVRIEDFGIAATGFGSILTSIIVLPQIIAKHLFPENSEEVRFGFIKENQKNDQSPRDNSDDEDLLSDNITNIDEDDSNEFDESEE